VTLLSQASALTSPEGMNVDVCANKGEMKKIQGTFLYLQQVIDETFIAKIKEEDI